MHVHCLHWLMWTGLLPLNAFCRPCKSTTGEMAPKEGPLILDQCIRGWVGGVRGWGGVGGGKSLIKEDTNSRV